MRWPHTIFVKSAARPSRMAGRRITYRTSDRPKAYLAYLIVYKLWKSAVPGRNSALLYQPPLVLAGRPGGGLAPDPAISASGSREYLKILWTAAAYR